MSMKWSILRRSKWRIFLRKRLIPPLWPEWWYTLVPRISLRSCEKNCSLLCWSACGPNQLPVTQTMMKHVFSINSVVHYLLSGSVPLEVLLIFVQRLWLTLDASAQTGLSHWTLQQPELELLLCSPYSQTQGSKSRSHWLQPWLLKCWSQKKRGGAGMGLRKQLAQSPAAAPRVFIFWDYDPKFFCRTLKSTHL